MMFKLLKPIQVLSGVAVVLSMTLGATAIQAQTVYRIVGPDGKVTFSDKPPVTNDKVTATGRDGKALPLGGAAQLPFELREVANRYPVTLYTSATCAPCGSGRALLVGRGIPFSERTISTNEDTEALQRISGETSLPFLTIGGQKIKGFSDTEWTQYLDAAAYPSTSKLSGTYRNPPAAPLVAIQKPAPGAEATQSAAKAPEAPRPAPVDNSSNPAGIKF